MIIRLIGIDPGLRRTGWGIIDVDGNRLIHVGHGAIATDGNDPIADRLVTIHRQIGEIVAAHTPAEAAIEDTFVSRDPIASLKLGHARGAALVALAGAGLACSEYAPNLIKKSVVGRGHADKRQVAAMVGWLLRFDGKATGDAADALAVAITHAHHRGAAALALATR